MPYALIMNEFELFDSRKKIPHQLIQDIGYNCIYAFSETWLSQNHPEEFWHVDRQDFDSFREDYIQTTKTIGGGIIMYIPKILKPCLHDDLNCFPDINFEILWFKLGIQKKCLLNL